MAPEAPAPATNRPVPSMGPAARLRYELRRVPPWAWALVFAIALCLPRLSRFGFWDPWELKLADQAREMARTGPLRRGRPALKSGVVGFIGAVWMERTDARPAAESRRLP